MSDKILPTTQAHLIASCDFKPLDEGEGTSVSSSGNGSLLDLRAALRSLAIEVVAANIKNYQDVGSNAGTIIGYPGIDVYSEQYGELRKVYGDNLDGNSTIEEGTISYDMSNLNDVLKGLEKAVDLMNFAKTNETPLNDLQTTYFELENDAILADEPTEGFYVSIKTAGNTYPGVWSIYLKSYLKYPEGSTEHFSSTKVFLSLLQGVGFAASRFLPILCTDNELIGRSSEVEDGSVYTIRPNPDLEFDLLKKLAYRTSPGEDNDSRTPIRYLFHTTAATASNWYNTVSGEIFNNFSGNPPLPDFFESENDLARLIMLLSRELSNSAAIAYYHSDDAEEIRAFLEEGGLEIDENHSFVETYSRNTTNLINNSENLSPFDSEKFRPAAANTDNVTVGMGAALLLPPDVTPTPQMFTTINLDNSSFPGQGTETTKCSLFESQNLLLDDDESIIGVREFLVGALFGLDEVAEFRTLNTTFSNNPELSRITRVQNAFNPSMTDYRDFILKMTALGEPNVEKSTHPRAVCVRLFCQSNLESLLNEMTLVTLEEHSMVIGEEGGTPEGGAIVVVDGGGEGDGDANPEVEIQEIDHEILSELGPGDGDGPDTGIEPTS
tara:strand:- start:217 stop:2046 length:1830 start_codon:yes stop_codon:yes gene_type:complete